MTKDAEIIDEVEKEQTEIILFSKLSVFLVTVILSPLLAIYLYCANVWLSSQKSKVYGTMVALLMCYFALFTPFLGFPLFRYYPPYVPEPHRFILAFVMIYPLWKELFEKKRYSITFPVLRVLSMVVLTGTYHLYQYVTTDNSIHGAFYGDYSIPLVAIVVFGFLLSLVGRFVWVLIKKRESKEISN